MAGQGKNTAARRRKRIQAAPRSTLSAASREFRWIDWIRNRAQPAKASPHKPGADNALELGIGDDAAAWKPKPKHTVVLTVDSQVDGVHFESSWLRLREIGRRAAMASLSDLAAMGAEPACLLAAIVLKNRSTRDFRQLYRGIEEAAKTCGARVVGGNISSGPLSISITSIGQCLARRLLPRSAAQVGDFLWVTGTPGLSRFGVKELRAGKRRARLKPPAARAVRRALEAYKRPHARTAEARFLAARGQVRAMVDVSDGLLADLGHILEASARESGAPLGAEIDEDACRALEHLEPLLDLYDESLATSLAGASDDYELCFTTAPTPLAKRCAKDFVRRFDLPLTCVGRITSRRGIYLRKRDGKTRRLRAKGWKHL